VTQFRQDLDDLKDSDRIRGAGFQGIVEDALFDLAKFTGSGGHSHSHTDYIFYYSKLMRFAKSTGSRPILELMEVLNGWAYVNDASDLPAAINDSGAYRSYFWEYLFCQDIPAGAVRDTFYDAVDIVKAFAALWNVNPINAFMGESKNRANPLAIALEAYAINGNTLFDRLKTKLWTTGIPTSALATQVDKLVEVNKKGGYFKPEEMGENTRQFNTLIQNIHAVLQDVSAQWDVIQTIPFMGPGINPNVIEFMYQ